LPDEIRLSDREQGIILAKWIEQAITEKVHRDRLNQLQDALSHPETWTMRRRHALARLTAEAGTRSPDQPSQEDVLDALRATIRQIAEGAPLARRIIGGGHPHDLYLVPAGRGTSRLCLIASSIWSRKPAR
jgi:hypothetical protein